LKAALDEIVVIQIITEVFGDVLNQIIFLFCREHFVSLVLFKAGTPSNQNISRATVLTPEIRTLKVQYIQGVHPEKIYP